MSSSCSGCSSCYEGHITNSEHFCAACAITEDLSESRTRRERTSDLVSLLVLLLTLGVAGGILIALWVHHLVHGTISAG